MEIDGHGDYSVMFNCLNEIPSSQRFCFGRASMRKVERKMLFAGCPKLNFHVCSGNQDLLAFYERLGYAIGSVLTFYKRLID